MDRVLGGGEVVKQQAPQSDTWNPDQYNKFRAERMLPFFDLFALIRPRPAMRVIDLGCGTGELTAMLAERLPDAYVEGIDASAAMLEQARPRAGERLTFRQADIREMEGFSPYDLVFSNAAFQWVPDNEGLVTRILAELPPGAQVAIQVPRGGGNPRYPNAADLAQEPAFRDHILVPPRCGNTLSLERYSQLLYQHGFREQACMEKIYGHELARTTEVIEFMKGTGLRQYLAQLDAAGQAEFLAAYRARLVEMAGDHSPYFFQMPRLLIWGIKTG